MEKKKETEADWTLLSDKEKAAITEQLDAIASRVQADGREDIALAIDCISDQLEH